MRRRRKHDYRRRVIAPVREHVSYRRGRREFHPVVRRRVQPIVKRTLHYDRMRKRRVSLLSRNYNRVRPGLKSEKYYGIGNRCIKAVARNRRAYFGFKKSGRRRLSRGAGSGRFNNPCK